MIIKVVSLNIWLGGFLLDNAVEFLKKQNADIVLLQEVFDGQVTSLEPRYRTMEVIKSQLGLPYWAFTPNYDQPDKHAKIGVAVFSRFPISTPATITDRPTSYNLQHTIVDTTDGEVDILNIHGPWDLDGDRFSPMRRDMARLIRELIEGRMRVILAGDTNAKSTNKVFDVIGEHLKSVYGIELTTTFNMRQKSDVGYTTAAVDAMFISRSMQVVKHDCPGVNVSDHLPLVASIDLA